MLEIYRYDYISGDVLVMSLYVIKLTQCKSSNIAICSFLVFFIQWKQNICLFHFSLLHYVHQFRECRNKKQI